MAIQHLGPVGDLLTAEAACATALARCRGYGDLYSLPDLLTLLADRDIQAGPVHDAAMHLREGLQAAARSARAGQIRADRTTIMSTHRSRWRRLRSGMATWKAGGGLGRPATVLAAVIARLLAPAAAALAAFAQPIPVGDGGTTPTGPGPAPAEPPDPYRPEACERGGRSRDRGPGMRASAHPGPGRGATLTARLSPDASTTPDRAAWMVGGRPRAA